MTFRSVIRFRVKPGAERAFEAAFQRAGMLTRPAAIDGFIEAELVRSLEDPTDYFVIGRWRTEQAYADWQAVSRDTEDADALAAFLDAQVDPSPGKLYRSVARSG